MTNSITYEQLHKKLRELGFSKHSVQLADGRKAEMFEHKTLKNALIVLPHRQPADQVERLYVGSVLATLKSRGLIPENDLFSS